MTESSSSLNARPVRKPAVSRSRRGVTFDSDAPRPMTELATAMLNRRRRSAGPVPLTVPSRQRSVPGSTVVLLTVDRSMSYALLPRGLGLQLERTTHCRADLQVSQTLFFSDCDAFDRWCDNDPLRFRQPQLHAKLKQRGAELLHEQRAKSLVP
jgi:hypothetical protein